MALPATAHPAQPALPPAHGLLSVPRVMMLMGSWEVLKVVMLSACKCEMQGGHNTSRSPVS